MPGLTPAPAKPVGLGVLEVGLEGVEGVDVRVLEAGVLGLKPGRLEEDVQLEPDVLLWRSACEDVPVEPLRLGIGQGPVDGGEVDGFADVHLVLSDHASCHS